MVIDYEEYVRLRALNTAARQTYALDDRMRWKLFSRTEASPSRRIAHAFDAFGPLAPEREPIARERVVAPKTASYWRWWLSATEWASYEGDDYCGSVALSDRDGLLVSSTIEDWCGDIRMVKGMVHSKSNLEDPSRPTIEAFARADKHAREVCQSFEGIDYTNETFENSRENLDWLLGLVLSDKPGGLNFETFEWEGRVYFASSGASHRFAATRQMARELHVPLLVRGTLTRCRVDLDSVDSLNARFRILQINGGACTRRELAAALQSLPRSWYYRSAPRHLWSGRCPDTHRYHDDHVCAIPRDETGQAVAEALVSRGAIDFGAVLRALAQARPGHRARRARSLRAANNAARLVTHKHLDA